MTTSGFVICLASNQPSPPPSSFLCKVTNNVGLGYDLAMVARMRRNKTPSPFLRKIQGISILSAHQVKHDVYELCFSSVLKYF